jgi:hypothetical protein
MRVTLTLWLVALLISVSGCGSRPEALFVGTLEAGTFWQKPLTSSTNEGSSYAKGCRVEVYDQFITVTTPDGLSHVHPHGYYSGLTIKKD